MTVLHRVFDSDLRVTARMRDWYAPGWLAAWMVLASRLGDGWLWLASTAALVAGPPSRHRLAVVNAAAAVAGNLLQVALKHSFRRPRPGDRATARYHELLAPDRFSFPSGHALNATLLAVLVGLEFPLLAPALTFLAGSIALSRVVLGLHFVSDVVAGVTLGAAVAALAVCVGL